MEQLDPFKKPKKNPRTEAGRAGGTATAKKHGPEFYKRIGSIGGKARKNPSKRTS